MSTLKKSQRIEIRNCPNKNPSFTEIFVDGQKLHGVRSYELKHIPGDVPVLTVDLNALNISIDEPMLLLQKGFGVANIKFQESPEDDSID